MNTVQGVVARMRVDYHWGVSDPSHETREKVVEVLLAARDLIAEEGHWCQGSDALNTTTTGLVAKPVAQIWNNTPLAPAPLNLAKVQTMQEKATHSVDPRSNNGVSFCSRGAIMHAAWELTGKANLFTPEERTLNELAMRVLSLVVGGDVIQFNDSVAYASRMVVEAFDRAAMAVKETL